MFPRKNKSKGVLENVFDVYE